MSEQLLIHWAREAARESANALHLAPSVWLLVWDALGDCRAYSTTSVNHHFSVPHLAGEHTRYSYPVIL